MADLTVDSLTELTAGNVAANDELGIWDVTASQYKKVLVSSLNGGIMTGAGTVATGGFTLAVPATGTAVLRNNGLFVRGTYTAGDTTPSVANCNCLYIANSGATTINDLDDGYDGQMVVLVFADANTTIARFGYLANSANFTSANHAVLVLVRIGSTWYEVARTQTSG